MCVFVWIVDYMCIASYSRRPEGTGAGIIDSLEPLDVGARNSNPVFGGVGSTLNC